MMIQTLRLTAWHGSPRPGNGWRFFLGAAAALAQEVVWFATQVCKLPNLDGADGVDSPDRHLGQPPKLAGLEQWVTLVDVPGRRTPRRNTQMLALNPEIMKLAARLARRRMQ